MIELYYWPTPNGHKISIFLEEASLDYQVYRLTSALATSSNLNFSEPRLTTACQRLSTQHQLMAVNQSQSLSQGQSCCI